MLDDVIASGSTLFISSPVLDSAHVQNSKEDPSMGAQVVLVVL